MKQPLKEMLKAIGGGHLLNEGLGLSNPKKVIDILKKELKSDIKVEKDKSGARVGYTFKVAGNEHGIYIDEAHDGIWEIYTVDGRGFPKYNHWKLSKFSKADIEDEGTALKALVMLVKSQKKFLLQK